ncbi:hypothetical protein [Micromonospora sp. WMMD1082]|uniref:hypothetical protein n=1 Tax=Micromonospora sp. WMMD1082 TaxID=3016104 RepID=UPI00241804CE|nr:hypothetical protein [Micromonospora sp. WMMD1082]MDG4793030.1 hypothetical protein [Micromonospora sp. WMMD1082]
MTDLDRAFDAVPAPIYTHHERHGETVHRSAPESIRRELAALQVGHGTVTTRPAAAAARR